MRDILISMNPKKINNIFDEKELNFLNSIVNDIVIPLKKMDHIFMMMKICQNHLITLLMKTTGHNVQFQKV